MVAAPAKEVHAISNPTAASTTQTPLDPPLRIAIFSSFASERFEGD
jgi:hypothetical protein